MPTLSSSRAQPIRILPLPKETQAVPQLDTQPVLVDSIDLAIDWVSNHRTTLASCVIELPAGDIPIHQSLIIPPDLPPLTITGNADTTRLVGSIIITNPHWKPVTDPAVLARLPQTHRQVRALALDPGALESWPNGLAGPSHRSKSITPMAIETEVFVDGQPLTLARWPDSGFAQVSAVTDPGSIPRNAAADIPKDQRVIEPPRGGTFRFDDHDRLIRWAKALKQQPDSLWMQGYWYWDWADEQLPVSAIDTDTNTITLGLPHVYGLRDSAHFYITNLPEELDTQGEYFIDHKTNTIYALLNENQLHDPVAISLLGGLMLICENTANLTLENLTFALSRSGAIKAKGVHNITIEQCTFADLGTNAIVLQGTGSTITRCRFADIGGTGIDLSGGDRKQLIPAENTIEHCTFQRTGRVFRTYHPAIKIDGVGQHILHNRISDLPHIAILFMGNDHTIAFNDIGHVVEETGDAGAIYTGRDWTTHGTTITNNYFHDITGSDGRYQNAVYLDDMASGITIANNLFIDCNWGMLIGGGRDITITNNALYRCRKGISFDARGVGWMAASIADPESSTILKRYNDMPVNEEPWKSRYPTLSHYLDEHFGRPQGSSITCNLFYATPMGRIDDKEMVHIQGNMEVSTDRKTVDARVRRIHSMINTPLPMIDTSEQMLIPLEMPAFQPIPLDRFGPQPARPDRP